MKAEEKINTFVIENKSSKYKLSLEGGEREIKFHLEELESLPKITFEENFTLESLKQKSKFFLMFETIEELMPDMLDFFKNKKYSLSFETNCAMISLFLPMRVVEEIILPIPQTESDPNSVIQELTITVNKLNKQINSMKLEMNEMKELEMNEMNKLNKEINSMKVEMNEMKELNKEINSMKLEMNEMKELNKQINSMKLEMNEMKEMKEFIYQLKEVDYFVCYINRKKALQSDKMIIDETERKLICDWISINRKVKMTLLYKATKDGDSSSAFHNKCDGKSPTLTLVKTTNGYRCGGFTSLPGIQAESTKRTTMPLFLAWTPAVNICPLIVISLFIATLSMDQLLGMVMTCAWRMDFLLQRTTTAIVLKFIRQ